VGNWTLLADRHHGNARSQALAWERMGFEAPSHVLPVRYIVFTTIQQTESISLVIFELLGLPSVFNWPGQAPNG